MENLSQNPELDQWRAEQEKQKELRLVYQSKAQAIELCENFEYEPTFADKMLIENIAKQVVKEVEKLHAKIENANSDAEKRRLSDQIFGSYGAEIFYRFIGTIFNLPISTIRDRAEFNPELLKKEIRILQKDTIQTLGFDGSQPDYNEQKIKRDV